jgi:hypothetical protein
MARPPKMLEFERKRFCEESAIGAIRLFLSPPAAGDYPDP